MHYLLNYSTGAFGEAPINTEPPEDRERLGDEDDIADAAAGDVEDLSEGRAEGATVMGVHVGAVAAAVRAAAAATAAAFDTTDACVQVRVPPPARLAPRHDTLEADEMSDAGGGAGVLGGMGAGAGVDTGAGAGAAQQPGAPRRGSAWRVEAKHAAQRLDRLERFARGLRHPAEDDGDYVTAGAHGRGGAAAPPSGQRRATTPDPPADILITSLYDRLASSAHSSRVCDDTGLQAERKLSHWWERLHNWLLTGRKKNGQPAWKTAYSELCGTLDHVIGTYLSSLMAHGPEQGETLSGFTPLGGGMGSDIIVDDQGTLLPPLPPPPPTGETQVLLEGEEHLDPPALPMRCAKLRIYMQKRARLQALRHRFEVDGISFNQLSISWT